MLKKIKGKNGWAMFLLMLAGVVLGGFLGEYLSRIPYMGWLNYGKPFGLDKPLALETGIVQLEFKIMIRFTIAGLLGIVGGILCYRKIG